ncbi:MAG: hypothetical protein DCE90_14965 [Pseudanabaena sp.]|nr:MAG: hypothetical protein DCE90_14965 [Pseudanabaena sp.]
MALEFSPLSIIISFNLSNLFNFKEDHLGGAMSKVQINNLINEINSLLSQPMGSVSRSISADTLQQREQLKQLRSHLENLTDDTYLGNLAQQYQDLVVRLQNKDQSRTNISVASNEKSKTDKLEIPSPLVRPVASNVFSAESDLLMENSTMTNGTPDPNSTFVNDRMIASLQQAIQQTLQQVVKESVQLSVQQVVSQTLAVERALMVGEISASLNKIVEAQQRSQISQELISLNQQKQKLSAEISQLESDRASWMQQFQEFQNNQQQSLDRSLQSVDNYLREQINDTLQQTVTTTVAESVSQTLQENLNNRPLPLSTPEPVQNQEFVNKVQEQTDRFLLQLDAMFSSTFRSLEEDIQGYQNAIAAKLGYMETLEQKGEALISSLVEKINQQSPSSADRQNDRQILNQFDAPISVDSFANLPEDIPPLYLETAIAEPADENLINALLAGNQFGEAVAATSTNDDIAPDAEVNTVDPEPVNPDITEIESFLAAPVDSLFEDSSPDNLGKVLDATREGFDSSIITEYRGALLANSLNPDFDVEATTQIVEAFNFASPDSDGEDDQNLFLDLPIEEAFDEVIAINRTTEADEDPELLRWLEDSSHSPSPAGFSDISPDEELMSWLGNDAIDMAKLSPQEQPQEIGIPLPELEVDLTSEEVGSLSINQIDDATDSQSPNIEKQIEQFFNDAVSDQADDSDESLILLPNGGGDELSFPDWEDSLLKELNHDLARLDAGVGTDPLIAANLDQFIRNTPYTITNWDLQESQSYPTIIEVSAQTSDSQADSPFAELSENEELEIPPIIENPETLFAEAPLANTSDLGEQGEIVVEIADLQAAPFATSSNELPEIFGNTDELFVTKDEPTALSPEVSGGDDMDHIFAEVIAENAAKYSQATPFETQDELDQLFMRSPSTLITETNITEPNYVDLNNPDQSLDLEDESGLDTLLFGFDPDLEVSSSPESDTTMQVVSRDEYDNIDVGAVTSREPITFSEPIEFIQELDTILQSYIPPSDRPDSEVTSFAELGEMPTVLELPNLIEQEREITQEDSWSAALAELEANLSQPLVEAEIPIEKPDLSADEFFASLEYEKLNSFADIAESSKSANIQESSSNILDELAGLIEDSEMAEDLLLNEFADAQNEQQESNQSEEQASYPETDWDNLLNDLNAFSFREPLLDDQRQMLGLSSVAPISDTSEGVLDIDSSVIELQRLALIAPPEPKENYSHEHNWILGVDFGSKSIRASLLNSDTGKVYHLSFGDAEEIPCKLAWSSSQNVDDPVTKDIRVLTKRAKSSGGSIDAGIEEGEIPIYQFKHFLKIGLPYRGVSAWQPIMQWSSNQQVSLRWLIAALKSLFEQIQTRAQHPQIPDLGLILLKLSGVVFGYPSNWSDTYILNVREAILKAGLVSQAEQVMAVEQAIAPALSLIHTQQIASEITLLIDVGAVSTSLCLTKEIGIPTQSQSLDRSKVHLLSFDYAGLSISQDIIASLFHPHWQLITNPNRHVCNFENIQFPEVGDPAIAKRILLNQYLLSSTVGQQMLELADQVKIAFSKDINLDTWNEEILGQPLVVLRRELENLILQPFIQRINRELNMILSNVGIIGDDVRQVYLVGHTAHIPLLSRWISQKLPNVVVNTLVGSAVASGLAVAPLYPALHNVARQQYSDYFLLEEICRLNLTKPVNPTQLLKQLQMQGINIKVCRDRILTFLQGDLPAGLFPWLEPEQAMVLEDPTLSSDLYMGKLFELETDGTYQPNVTKFQQLRVYLQAITSNMSQTLNEPLVFPELVN